ncbi:MAG: glycosyltransferase family 4 protein [Gaiellaceae bacterium]
MRVCIVYDCLYPYTIGGAERWYRGLAERAAKDGHEVTYLTRRQWRTGGEPTVAGVRVVAVSPSAELYTREGRRRTTPPLAFGAGVFRHLLAHGSAYDVVHTASFPYFSLLAAAAARRRHEFRIFVDWHEVWTREYWESYLGPTRGRLGWRIQRLCLRVPQRAFCFSRLHERRLREAGLEPLLLEGQYTGTTGAGKRAPAEPVVVFAGRHIPEKRVRAIVPAITNARAQIPGLRGDIYGDGPERREVLRLIAESGLDAVVAAPGFVESERIDQALATALCLLLPSSREGYGLVVLEAAARGTPTVVVRGPDNAAAELVEEGVNGVVAASAAPADLAEAIVRVQRAGLGLRGSTLDWFRRNAERLSLERSLVTIFDEYARS